MREHAVLLKEISEYLDGMPENTEVDRKVLAIKSLLAITSCQWIGSRGTSLTAPHVAEDVIPA